MQKIKTDIQNDYLVVGELGLSGELRPIQGALAIAMLAKESGKKGILLPAANAQEAAALPGIHVIAIHHLNDAVAFLQNPKSIVPTAHRTVQWTLQPYPAGNRFCRHQRPGPCETRHRNHRCRQPQCRFSGPPGSGKTMIAKAMAGIMPELTIEEALEVTKIHSISGLLGEGKSLVTHRPFRSPITQ